MENNTEGGSRFSRGFLAVCVALVTTLSMGAAGAAAQVDPDPTGEAMGDVQAGITTWVTSYGIPAIVAILLLGVGLALLVKFTRKAKSAV